MKESEVIEAMRPLGGSFAKALAEAFNRADSENFNRLRVAFPELWAEYADLAEMRKARASQ